MHGTIANITSRKKFPHGFRVIPYIPKLRVAEKYRIIIYTNFKTVLFGTSTGSRKVFYLLLSSHTQYYSLRRILQYL